MSARMVAIDTLWQGVHEREWMPPTPPPIIHQNKVKALRCLLAKQCGPPMVPSAITGMSLVNLVASVHLNSLILIAIFDQKAPMNISSSPITLQGCMKTMGVFLLFFDARKTMGVIPSNQEKKSHHGIVLFDMRCRQNPTYPGHALTLVLTSSARL